MEIVYKKINDLKPYENNPRINDEAVEYVAKSIKEFGFKVPCVIDENGTIITGHTRYKASKMLGLKEIPCLIASDLTEEQIKAFRLADNKVSDYSIWDNKKLLQELEEIGFDIFSGFSISDLFEDILNENDNEILEENENGVEYTITIKSQDKDLINRINEYAEKEMQ